MRPLPTDRGEYFVDESGGVFSMRAGQLRKLKLNKTRQGYLMVWLWRNGVKRQWRVHRLVAELYIPNPRQCSDVNHRNSVRDDNRVENLEWVTRSENIKHGFDYGRAKPTRGGISPRCKITTEQVNEICASTESVRALVAKFGVSNQHIYRIRLRQRRYDESTGSRY
jgi:hypothetical protein